MTNGAVDLILNIFIKVGNLKDSKGNIRFLRLLIFIESCEKYPLVQLNSQLITKCEQNLLQKPKFMLKPFVLFTKK